MNRRWLLEKSTVANRGGRDPSLRII